MDESRKSSSPYDRAFFFYCPDSAKGMPLALSDHNFKLAIVYAPIQLITATTIHPATCIHKG